eukprot:CAMPEP_0115273560 /NCGR_PEP_ID=MMETSP0270-20121206/55203_1 /TAXON_ID=71861 /ORGANISM="Scrippsiella trochoidea, Strain CCMP3099" /LENGTH=62 /DNA_ID=CAMNT_0002690005 /DNA_START=43 /DNA_END=228 /DNA_ORIENTATION=-
MTKDKDIRKDITGQNLAKRLLALDELKLIPIPEEDTLNEENLPVGAEMIMDAADNEAALNRC